MANRSDYRYNRNVYHLIFNRFYIYTNVYSYSKNNEAIKGVNKEKSEKKPSILISLFALTCFGLCYYIAGYPQGYITEKNAQNGSVFLIMLSILPLVVVGTYLFFSQTFLLFIYILKKRRKFYLKQINMLWISDLVSRTRSNINVLFIVSMLSALAFTIIIGLFAANNNTKAPILERYPIPFTYIRRLMHLNKSILLRLKLNLQMLIFNMTNINLPF